jgi:hypothetical protein
MEPEQSRSSSSYLSELLVFFQPYKSSSTTLAAVAYRRSQSSSTALPRLQYYNIQEFKLTCIYIRA